MNFTNSIKSEIIKKPAKDKCCKKAFLAGLIRGSGEIYETETGIGFDFRVPDEETGNLVSGYFKVLYGFEIREISVSEDRLNKKDNIVLSVSGERAEEILKDLSVFIEREGFLDVNLKFYGDITKKDCCLRAFLRGLFFSVGSCTVPNETGSVNTRYHLEITFTHSAPAMDTADVLGKNGIEMKITRRKEKYVAYIKSTEGIKDFLAFIGAPVSVLKITDMMVNAELSNVSNRRANCDVANVTRQIDACEKHLLAIKKIEEKVGLKFLKDDLYETAVARKKYSEDTLSELAERLNITKSCLNHRLRKIVLTANEL